MIKPRAPCAGARDANLTATAAPSHHQLNVGMLLIQVYKYYRDLINFKTQGDPMVMLKCVNPKEAALLDAASGTHVKFRLAGVSTLKHTSMIPPHRYTTPLHHAVKPCRYTIPLHRTVTPCRYTVLLHHTVIP